MTPAFDVDAKRYTRKLKNRNARQEILAGVVILPLFERLPGDGQALCDRIFLSASAQPRDLPPPDAFLLGVAPAKQE